MQDAVPTLAVLAAYNGTPVRFTGIENLRVKECDRIHALWDGLNRIRQGLAEKRATS
jgi:3-phosphoshikimate 1-carboxyvinyltransferase